VGLFLCSISFEPCSNDCAVTMHNYNVIGGTAGSLMTPNWAPVSSVRARALKSVLFN
jgi:hypothetical protein